MTAVIPGTAGSSARREAPAWMNARYVGGLVSVIIPTYNRARLLGDTLDSVLEQDYRPIEIVVVDDGSKDSTQDVVQAWKVANASGTGCTLQFVRRDVNAGPAAARNQGLLVSRGEFIQFLDSDDRLHLNKLSSQVHELLQDPTLDYAYGVTAQITESGQRLGSAGQPMDPQRSHWNIARQLWHTAGPLYRRAVCVEAGPWNEELIAHEDWEYGARVKLVSQRGKFFDKVVSLYVAHGGHQISRVPSQAVVESRSRAVKSVASMLKRAKCRDRNAMNILGRSLAAIALLRWLALDDRPAMRRGLLEARALCSGAHACVVRALYLGSFCVPKAAYAGALTLGRAWRQRASVRRLRGMRHERSRTGQRAERTM